MMALGTTALLENVQVMINHMVNQIGAIHIKMHVIIHIQNVITNTVMTTNAKKRKSIGATGINATMITINIIMIMTNTITIQTPTSTITTTPMTITTITQL